MLHKEDNIATQNLHAGFVQAHCTYEDRHRAGPSHLLTDPAASLEVFCHKGHTRVMFEDWGSLQVSPVNYDRACHLPTISDPCNSSSTSCFSFGNLNPQPDQFSESILNLETSYAFSSLNPLVLSCEEEQPNSHLMFSHGGSGVWPDTTIFSNHQLHHLNSKCNTLLPQEINCLEGASSHEPVVNFLKENKREEESIWLYPEETVPGDDLQKFRGAEGGSHKRPYMTGVVPSSKRHCDGAHKSSKAGEPVASKYPHSIAAKNRRERISERLKILQDLVPNSTKLDLVTMLDKAISYVKFLQLQVKVLTTDEFWPTNDGKVPDVARMMEAIDAVLSSHKDSF